MQTTKELQVMDTRIRVQFTDQGDYINLNDASKKFHGKQSIYSWIRNNKTIDFLDVWERLHNPNYKGGYAPTLHRGSKTKGEVKLTPKIWIETTDAIGIKSVSGKGGGTYAHFDVAAHFLMWLDPEWNLFVIKEFKRLKEEEQKRIDGVWQSSRMMSIGNFVLQNDAVKAKIIPNSNRPVSVQWTHYSDEADMLNKIIFGKTAKQWREETGITNKNDNMRNYACFTELLILSNVEYENSKLIEQGIPQKDRYEILSGIVEHQKKVFANKNQKLLRA